MPADPPGDGPALDEHEPEPGIAESLELIDSTRAHAERELADRDGPVWHAWGLAWVVAFGVSFLGDPAASRLAVPDVVMALVWPVCIGAALVFTLAYQRRQHRGRSGRSEELDTRFGMAYFATMALAALLVPMLGLVPSAADAPMVLWEIGMVFVFAVSVIFLFDGAFRRDNPTMVVALWIGVVNAVSGLALIEWYGAVLAVLGGGALIALGAWRQAHPARGAA